MKSKQNIQVFRVSHLHELVCMHDVSCLFRAISSHCAQGDNKSERKSLIMKPNRHRHTQFVIEMCIVSFVG